MDADDLRSLSRVLTYGTPATLRALALRLASDPDSELPIMLLASARLEESPEMRDRCEEVLGIMAGAGHRAAARLVDDPTVPA